MKVTSLIIIVSSLSSVASQQQPSCSVCGDRMEVGNPDAAVSFPGQSGQIPCGVLENLGVVGLIPPPQCEVLPQLISTVCECQPINPPPTLKPTPKPTPKPIPFTKSSKAKSSKSTSCTSSKSSKSRRRKRSKKRRCSKSSKSSSRSRRRIEPPTVYASIRRSPARDTYEFDSEAGAL